MHDSVHHIWNSMDTAEKAVTIGSLTVLVLVLFFALLSGMYSSYKRSEMEARLQIGLTLGELPKRPGR
jgi:hypothetical protein